MPHLSSNKPACRRHTDMVQACPGDPGQSAPSIHTNIRSNTPKNTSTAHRTPRVSFPYGHFLPIPLQRLTARNLLRAAVAHEFEVVQPTELSQAKVNRGTRCVVNRRLDQWTSAAGHARQPARAKKQVCITLKAELQSDTAGCRTHETLSLCRNSVVGLG